MKKLFLTLTALCVMSTAAWAADDDYTGGLSEGALLEWELPSEGGTMTISGSDTNPMNDFILGNQTWGTPWDRDAQLAAKIQHIDMQKGLNIGKYAFCELPNLESITLHGIDNSTRTRALYCIGDYAFQNSPKLATINSEILSELRYIGTYAFAGTAIKTFTINKPEGNALPTVLTTDAGFTIDLNREHCYISDYAFADCDHLTTVYMMDATPFTETYNNFLNDHTYLVVNDEAAATAYKAAWPEIADQIIYLAQSVTFENETFKDICISHWDTNGDGELSYEEAFAVTTFGDVFKGNTSLKEITLSDLMPFVNVTIIGSGTFEGCTALEKITIPSHIEDIADDAFTGCTSLKEIHFTTALPFKEEFTIQLNDRTHIIVPDAYLPTYDATWTNKSELIIGESHIPFQCPTTKSICVTNWDTNKDGELSYAEAAAVKNISTKFQSTAITSFEELRYFTSLTSIGYDAFYRCSSLTAITIPEGVTSIGGSAFQYCSSLTAITIPEGVTSIGSSAFEYCSSLTSITIPEGVTSIGSSAFEYCSSLTSITIPASVTSIGSTSAGTSSYVFNGCTSLKEVIFLDSDEELWLSCDVYSSSGGKGMFSSCPLETVYIGRNIKYMAGSSYSGYSPFAKIQSLKSVTLGDKVTYIVSEVFYGCSSLTSINIPEGSQLTSIGHSAFYECCSLTSITIPKGVTSIGEATFYGCSSLTAINIPEGSQLTSIGKTAFYKCSNLPSINIPEGVTSIGSKAFDDCRSLTSINIPESVTNIGTSAFWGVPEYVYFLNTTPITYNNFSDKAVYVVPDALVEAYKSAWTDVAYRIIGESSLNGREAECTAAPTSSHLAELIGEANLLNVYKLKVSGTINSYDMMVMANKMKNLRHLDLSDATIVANTYKYDGSTSSQDNVFPGFLTGNPIISLSLPNTVHTVTLGTLANLRSIRIPESVTTLGINALKGCSGLTKVEIPINSKLQVIGASAFSSTSSLITLDLTNATQLQTIANNVFYSSRIETILLPSSLKTIGNNAFESCKRLKAYSGPASIGQYAFKGCTSLKQVTLTSGATSVGNYAFNGCTALQSFAAAESLASIGQYAFEGCTALNSVIVAEGLTSIGNYAFKGATALKEISLPSSLTSLGTYAFQGCTSLETVEIGMGITSVPQYLFSGCTALKNVKLSPKTTTIQSYAFQYCSGLTEFHLPPYLTTIQSNAFSGCTNLKEIYAYMPDVPAIAASTFSNYTSSTLYAPAFLWDAYFYDNGWNKFLNVLKCNLRPGDYEAFYTNKDLYFKEGEQRITHDRPIVELGNQGAIIVEGAVQQFTSVDMLRGTTSSSLIGDGNITMDELRVKISVNANRWYFLCFPYDVAIDGCEYPGKYAWRYYDGATRAANGTGGWQKIEGNTLKAGVGYIFQSNTAGNLIVKFAEPEFGGDRPTTLSAYNCTNAANASWNFVGNPYASYYNVEAEDFTSPITVWNGSTYVAYRPGDDDYHLQPYEAFFVQKTEDASAVNFDADRRETYTMSKAVAASQAQARRERGITPERLIVNLTISDNDTAAIDRTRLVMNAKASRDYEMACDASKFISDDAAAQLYTLEGSVKMAINERPGDGEVRLGYIAAKAGTLRLEAQRMDMPMEIIDTETDRTFDLSQGAYEFTTKAGTFDNRFVMRASREATEIMTLTAATGVAIGMQEGGLSIGGADDKCISIYAANGALVAEHYGNGYVALASGTYVVKVDGHSAKMYVK